MNLKYGDELPQALSPQEANGIRVYADHLYGNYDRNTKSLLQKSLLGSIVLQFKTYTLQQFLQNVRDTGHINVTKQIHRKSDDGEKLYWKVSTTMEDFQEHGAGQILKESELEGVDMTNVVPYVELMGSPTGGKIATDVEMAKDILFNHDKFLEN